MSGSTRLQRFFAELKRRGVFRAAAFYGPVAFVAIEVADLVFPRLALPEWTITAVVWLAILGFPVAISAAWVYERTSVGIRTTGRVESDELDAIVAEPRRRRWPVGIAALLGVALLALGAWWTLTRSGPGARTYDSIAVLPFANLSGNPDNAYFSDGLAEELINALAGVEDLRVAGRTSSFALRDQNLDLRTIGDTLGVATVLEGSVRRSEDRVRINAQLIDARTGFQLWSREYDRDITDIFAVQDEIAKSIVDALLPRLGGRDESLYRGGTKSVAAYDLYLSGRQRWYTRRVPELVAAVDEFEQAIAIDSSFALAWSGLADAIDALAYRDARGIPLLPQAKRAALRAVLLDPGLAEGWASVGLLAHEAEQDWKTAELAFERALALKPSYAPAAGWLGDALRSQGRLRESLAWTDHALVIDPLSPVVNAARGFSLVVVGEYEAARRQYERTLTTGGDLEAVSSRIVQWGEWMGFPLETVESVAEDMARRRGFAHPQTARVIARALADGASSPSVRDSAVAVIGALVREGILSVPRNIAGYYALLGERELAIEWLARAVREGDPTAVSAGVDPSFDSIRDDPRMEELTAALDVPNGYDPANDTFEPGA